MHAQTNELNYFCKLVSAKWKSPLPVHNYTVQDDLLAGVIFGGFACGKKLADFILAISS